MDVVQAGAGRVRVTLRARRPSSWPTNRIESVRFATVRNAEVDIGASIVNELPKGVTGAPMNELLTTFANVDTMEFFVRRRDAGAFTASLIVNDRCGPWTTFAGGAPNRLRRVGTSAGAGAAQSSVSP
jgi:hypothetical protein